PQQSGFAKGSRQITPIPRTGHFGTGAWREFDRRALFHLPRLNKIDYASDRKPNAPTPGFPLRTGGGILAPGASLLRANPPKDGDAQRDVPRSIHGVHPDSGRFDRWARRTRTDTSKEGGSDRRRKAVR